MASKLLLQVSRGPEKQQVFCPNILSDQRTQDCNTAADSSGLTRPRVTGGLNEFQNYASLLNPFFKHNSTHKVQVTHEIGAVSRKERGCTQQG